jgi:hypothetical protein
MRQMIKNSLWISLLAGGLQTSWAYSLGGPIANGGDAWQQPVIGYGLPGDVNAPKNLGEEYRRDTPVLYYTYNANFLDYFGSNGVAAVDSAFAVLNALTNVDDYSKMLSEFPLESRHQNYEAQALGLLDLKSASLGLMVEQLGLADPVRYDWTLHDRDHVGPVGCPVGQEYLVIQRNFDYFSTPLNELQYSPYINDTLYSYQIYEACTGPNPLALAVPFSVDPLADFYSPIASYVSGTAFWGDYYTGLTRDDVAGLRYLLTTNNVNWETPAPGALLVTTNLGASIPVTTSNLFTLLQFAQTNDPALIPGTFPNVGVTSFSNYWTVVCTPNIVSYFTNYYGEPSTTAPHFVVATNGFTCAPQQNFVDTFGNVYTNALANYPGIIFGGNNIFLSYSPQSSGRLVTTYLANQIGAPVGSPLVTNTSSQTVVFSGLASGEYITLTTNTCGWSFLSPQPPGFPLANVVTVTNLITSSTNTATTNASASGFVGTENLVTTFTNHTYIVQPIICTNATPTPSLYQGIGRIQFVRADYDSLLGQYFQPVTNNYTMVAVTNGRPVTLRFQRIVTQPDFLFSAQDIATTPQDNLIGVTLGLRNLNFDQGNVLANLAGPGTITPATTITFDKVGPVYFNAFGDVLDGTPYFNETPGGDISDLFYLTYFVWANFDGTTNAPVVFPDGTSVDNLQRQVLTQISPTTLPTITQGTTYANIATFTATGGGFSPPYTWSASGLPDGLTITSSGTLHGTPTQTGTFDFVLILTDSLGRSGQWGYPITISSP